MKLHLASDEAEAQLWEQFVENHAECSNYHRWGWKQVIENSFHWPTYYLMLEEANSIRGILPLVWQRSRMFGSFLTSLPFLNCGGVVAETKATKDALAAKKASRHLLPGEYAVVIGADVSGLYQLYTSCGNSASRSEYLKPAPASSPSLPA